MIDSPLSSAHPSDPIVLENRLAKLRTAAETSYDVALLAATARSLPDLFHSVAERILSRFEVYSVCIFMVEEAAGIGYNQDPGAPGSRAVPARHLILVEAAGAQSDALKARGSRIVMGSRSMIGWVASHNQPRVTGDVKQEFFYQPDDILLATRSEASFPVAMGEGSNATMLGVLDVQHTHSDVFDPDAVAALQAVANHLAQAIQNFRLMESAQRSLRELSALYSASQQMTQATTTDEIYRALSNTLLQSDFPMALLTSYRGHGAGHGIVPIAGRSQRMYVYAYKKADQSSAIWLEPGLAGSAPTGLSASDTPLMADLPALFRQEVETLFQNVVLAEIEHSGRIAPTLVLDLNLEASLQPDPTLSGGESSGETSTSGSLSGGQAYPPALLEIPRRLGCSAAAYIPIFSSKVTPDAGRNESIPEQTLQEGKTFPVLEFYGLMILGGASYTVPAISASAASKSGDDSTSLREVARSKQPALPLITSATMQSFSSLAELTATVLEKVLAMQATQRHMQALQTLNLISQAVSVETDLDQLYQLIHTEVVHMMGEVSFLIATYDPLKREIFIPYMYEWKVDDEQGLSVSEPQPIETVLPEKIPDSRETPQVTTSVYGPSPVGKGYIRTIDPFPLGQGLTSILLTTRKPLLLVGDIEAKTRELGAITVGRMAKSWLGVPLLIADEPVGAIVVQDAFTEYRFDQEDLRIMEILASQVAVAIRSARLLDSVSQQARRERLLHEITSKIRSSTNMRSILAVTATELRQALDAQKAHIELFSEPDENREDHILNSGKGNEDF